MAVQRKQVPNEVREHLVRSYEDPTQDYLMAADTMGENWSMARGISTPFTCEGRVQQQPLGGRNNKKVEHNIDQCLNNIVGIIVR